MSLFFKPKNTDLWDTWIYFRENTFYMYYLTKTDQVLDGVGLAISPDGVQWRDYGKVIEKSLSAVWLGSGAVWPALNEGESSDCFVMNFSEWHGDPETGGQIISFAVSNDLVQWRRLAPQFEFAPDISRYKLNGRWDNIWPVARPGGGYHGYWAATPNDGAVGLGFGESEDGIVWNARDPAVLREVMLGSPKAHSPEVASVIEWRGRYFALLGLDDLQPFIIEEPGSFRPGQTVFTASSAAGPFSPAPINRKLLIGNASYFARFVETPHGLLVNHHSWEVDLHKPLGVGDGTSCLAPLKRAEWDGAGTLRLKWWEGNSRSKLQRVDQRPSIDCMAFDPDRTLILEGQICLTSEPSGLHIPGLGARGTTFLIRRNGTVEYGESQCDGARFDQLGSVDRKLDFGEEASFRLIRSGRITEFYVNDYLMQCYCLPAKRSGSITLIGQPEQFSDVRAWYCSGDG